LCIIYYFIIINYKNMDTSYLFHGDEERAHSLLERQMEQRNVLPSFTYEHEYNPSLNRGPITVAPTLSQENDHRPYTGPYNLRSLSELRHPSAYPPNPSLFSSRQSSQAHLIDQGLIPQSVLNSMNPIGDHEIFDQRYGIQSPGHFSQPSTPYESYPVPYPIGTPGTMRLNTPFGDRTPYGSATPSVGRALSGGRSLSSGRSLSGPHQPYGTLKWS
jgi:hypothetical protein